MFNVCFALLSLSANSLHNFLVSPQITKINKTLCVITFVTTMSEGEVDLETLIQTMSPRLHPDIYVFMSLHHNDSVPKLVTDSSVFTFRETEGRTFVLPRATVGFTCIVHITVHKTGFVPGGDPGLHTVRVHLQDGHPRGPLQPSSSR